MDWKQAVIPTSPKAAIAAAPAAPGAPSFAQPPDAKASGQYVHRVF